MFALTPKSSRVSSHKTRQGQNRRHAAEKAGYLPVFSVSHRTPVGQTESLLLIRIETG